MKELLDYVIKKKSKLSIESFEKGFQLLLDNGIIILEKAAMDELDQLRADKLEDRTGEDLQDIFNSIKLDYEDLLGSLQSLLETSKIFESTHLHAYLLSPFRFSELLIVESHDIELGDVDGITFSDTHMDIEDQEFLYGVSILSKSTFDDDKCSEQIIKHEVTHYVINYMNFTFSELHLMDYLDCIALEFLADSLQFVYNGHLEKYKTFASKYFSEERNEQYKPYLEVMERLLS